MSESEDILAKARFNLSIVKDCIEIARRLREKAKQLERDGERLKADAVLDLAEYFEEAAADIGEG